MSIIQIIPLLLLAAVVVVNLVTLALWYLLYQLVLSSDPLIGEETGATYTAYLFGQMMEGGISPTKRMKSLGSPDRDRLIRTVKGSQAYAVIAGIANRLKHIPLNFVLMYKSS